MRAEAHLAGHAYHTYRLTSPDGLVSFEFQARAHVPAFLPPMQLTFISWCVCAAQRVRAVHLCARHCRCCGVHRSARTRALLQDAVQHGGRAFGRHGLSCNAQLLFTPVPSPKLVDALTHQVPVRGGCGSSTSRYRHISVSLARSCTTSSHASRPWPQQRALRGALSALLRGLWTTARCSALVIAWPPRARRSLAACACVTPVFRRERRRQVRGRRRAPPTSSSSFEGGSRASGGGICDLRDICAACGGMLLSVGAARHD